MLPLSSRQFPYMPLIAVPKMQRASMAALPLAPPGALHNERASMQTATPHKMDELPKNDMSTNPPRKVPRMLPAVERAYSRPTVAPDVSRLPMRKRMA